MFLGFLGTHAPRLDDKGRLVLPAKFRDALAGGLVLTKGQDRSIVVWPAAEFGAYAERLNEASRSNPKVQAYARVLFSGASDEVPDRHLDARAARRGLLPLLAAPTLLTRLPPRQGPAGNSGRGPGPTDRASHCTASTEWTASTDCTASRPHHRPDRDLRTEGGDMSSLTQPDQPVRSLLRVGGVLGLSLALTVGVLVALSFVVDRWA